MEKLKGPRERRGTQKVKTLAVKEALLDFIAMLDRRGHTQGRIVEMIPTRFDFQISQPQVSLYLKEVRERYKARIMDQREELVAEKLEQYREIRAEAWEEWERSKQPKCRRSIEKVPPPPSKDDRKKDKRLPKRKNSREQQVEDWRKELVRVRETVTREGRLGASQYLTIILETLEAERQLLGIDEMVSAMVGQVKSRNAVVDEIAAVMAAVDEQCRGLPERRESTLVVVESNDDTPSTEGEAHDDDATTGG